MKTDVYLNYIRNFISSLTENIFHINYKEKAIHVARGNVGTFCGEAYEMHKSSGKMRFITARASGTYSCHCASNERGLPCVKTLFASLLTRSTGLNPRPFYAGVLVGKVAHAFLGAFLCHPFIIPPMRHVSIHHRRYMVS